MLADEGWAPTVGWRKSYGAEEPFARHSLQEDVSGSGITAAPDNRHSGR
jgi:hypothetical protein